MGSEGVTRETPEERSDYTLHLAAQQAAADQGILLYRRKKELLFWGTSPASLSIWEDLKDRILSQEATAVFEPSELIKDFDLGVLKKDCSFIIYSYTLID